MAATTTLTQEQQGLLSTFNVPPGYVDALKPRCGSTDIAVACSIVAKLKKLSPTSVSDELISDLVLLEAGGIDVYDASTLPENDRGALAGAIDGSNTDIDNTWDNARLKALIAHLGRDGDTRDDRATTLLPHDANDVLSVLDDLTAEYVLDELLDAIALGIPTSDMAWRARLDVRYELGEDYRIILGRIAKVTDRDQRRLALLLASRAGQQVPYDAAIALATSIETGHDEIARYIADGQTIAQAVTTARAQAALDTQARTRITAPRSQAHERGRG